MQELVACFSFSVQMAIMGLMPTLSMSQELPGAIFSFVLLLPGFAIEL